MQRDCNVKIIAVINKHLEKNEIQNNYPESLSGTDVLRVVESERSTCVRIWPAVGLIGHPLVFARPLVSSSDISSRVAVVNGFVVPGVVAVVVQSERTDRQEENETQRVVNDLQERLVSSRGAPQVGDEQRQRHQQHTTDCDQSDIVTVVECSRKYISSEIQRVGADQDQADQSDNLNNICKKRLDNYLVMTKQTKRDTYNFSQLHESMGASQKPKVRHCVNTKIWFGLEMKFETILSYSSMGTD